MNLQFCPLSTWLLNQGVSVFCKKIRLSWKIEKLPFWLDIFVLAARPSSAKRNIRKDSIKWDLGELRFGEPGRHEWLSIRSVSTWRKFQRWQDTTKEYSMLERLKKVNRSTDKETGMYFTADDPKLTFKQRPEDMTREESGAMAFDTMAAHYQMRTVDHSLDAIKRFLRYHQVQQLQYDQRFLPERHLYLGNDLASAHFIVHRDGAVKFVGEDVWYKKNEKGKYVLPGGKVPGLYVEAIDASRTKLVFEGLENMMSLRYLRFLSLAECDYMNDWCMGRLTQFEDTLEYLDLSHCANISARGLNGLVSLKKLRYLRLDGFGEKKDIGKVAVMLEDAMPGLEVLGLDYEHELGKLNWESKLMAHPDTVVDARSNVHIEDSEGEHFYLRGNVPQNCVVDDDDLPLVMTTIRRDPPELAVETLDELEELSEGKLKHLLVGSPSGLSWTQESERILQFETKKRLKNKNADLHPFLTPKHLRDKILERETKRQIEHDSNNQDSHFFPKIS